MKQDTQNKTKEIKKKKPASRKVAEKEKKDERVVETSYIRTIGRRKKAIANIKIFSETEEKKEFLINKKNIKVYFSDFELQKIVFAPLKKTNSDLQQKGRIEVSVKGGGKKGQAEAIRLAVSRALIKINPDLREILKSQKYLTCDSRVKERKKFGLKKARKAPQWSKR